MSPSQLLDRLFGLLPGNPAPFDAAVLIFAAVVVVTAIIAMVSFTDDLRVRHEFLRQGINGMRKRFVRFRTQLGAELMCIQILMFLAAMVGHINPAHTGVWLLAIFSLVEAMLATISLSGRAVRQKTLDDLERAEEALHQVDEAPIAEE